MSVAIGRRPAVAPSTRPCHMGAGQRAVILALEKRVLFELPLDVGRELQVGEFEQLDRLLKLRRHHQGLGLPQIEALGQGHNEKRLTG